MFEAAIGIDEALDDVQLAKPGSEAQVQLCSEIRQQLRDVCEPEGQGVRHGHPASVRAIDSCAAFEERPDRSWCVVADRRLERTAVVDLDICACANQSSRQLVACSCR